MNHRTKWALFGVAFTVVTSLVAIELELNHAQNLLREGLVFLGWYYFEKLSNHPYNCPGSQR